MNPSNSINPTNSLKTHLLFLPLLVIGFIAAYHTTLAWMYGRYMSADSYYSHGFIIPFVSGYLIWLKRKELKTIEVGTSWLGFVLVVLAALIHLFGTVVYIFSVSGFSIWMLLIGCCLFMYGWARIREISFPLLFLFFMFPAPLAVITKISFPLKMLVAKYGVQLVALASVPVHREGFNITIPQGTLLVGNPCSGLRSLITFLALGSLFTYLSNLSTIRKWVLLFLAIPIALLSNLIRVPVLILWSYKFGLAAAAPGTIVHTGSGFAVFVFGIFLLYFAMFCLGGTRES